MLLEQPLYYLSTSDRHITAIFTVQRVEVLEHFVPLISAEVTSILGN